MARPEPSWDNTYPTENSPDSQGFTILIIFKDSIQEV